MNVVSGIAAGPTMALVVANCWYPLRSSSCGTNSHAGCREVATVRLMALKRLVSAPGTVVMASRSLDRKSRSYATQYSAYPVRTPPASRRVMVCRVSELGLPHSEKQPLVVGADHRALSRN